MEKEFNLSDEIIEAGGEVISGIDLLAVDDVINFIKRLKDKIKYDSDLDDLVLIEIDKLVGNKLK